MHQAIVQQQQQDIGPVVGGSNEIVNTQLFRNSIIYKDQELENFIKEQEQVKVEDLQHHEIERQTYSKLEFDRLQYIQRKKKTEDEEQLYQNLLQHMFPGYAQTYHEQQYVPQVNQLSQQIHQSLAAVQRHKVTEKETQSEHHATDDDTINLSIRSSEKVNIFEVELNDIHEINEPFQTEVSMIVFDTQQFKQNKTGNALEENSCLNTLGETNPNGVSQKIDSEAN